MHLCQLFCYGCLCHSAKIIYLFPCKCIQGTHTQNVATKERRGKGGDERDLQYSSTHCVITRRESYVPLFYPKQRASTAPVLVPQSRSLPAACRSCSHSFNLTNGTARPYEGTEDNCVLVATPNGPLAASPCQKLSYEMQLKLSDASHKKKPLIYTYNYIFINICICLMLPCVTGAIPP